MKKADYSDFVRVVSHMLGIRQRVRVRYYLRHIPGLFESCGGQQVKRSGMHFYHNIMINLHLCAHNEGVRGILETLAHELAHCFVDENHPRASVHGRTFQRTCSALRRALRAEHGITIAPLYLPKVDK